MLLTEKQEARTFKACGQHVHSKTKQANPKPQIPTKKRCTTDKHLPVYPGAAGDQLLMVSIRGSPVLGFVATSL